MHGGDYCKHQDNDDFQGGRDLCWGGAHRKAFGMAAVFCFCIVSAMYAFFLYLCFILHKNFLKVKLFLKSISGV